MKYLINFHDLDSFLPIPKVNLKTEIEQQLKSQPK
jgi:hypothetical protein